MSAGCKKGFTLIEISSVLVIIGLLIGGIFVGRDLIHAAELRATINQVSGFNLAFYNFRLKYDCIAGDCRNADQLGFTPARVIARRNDNPFQDSIWDVLNPVSAAHAYTPVEIIAVIGAITTLEITLHSAYNSGQVDYLDANNEFVLFPNGDGNDKIEWLYEYLGAMWQLKEAGFITKLTPQGGEPIKIPAPSPVTGRQGVWSVLSYQSPIPGASLVQPGKTYYTTVGDMAAIGLSSSNNAIIRREDIEHIDAKLDDGLATTGSVLGTPNPSVYKYFGPVLDPMADMGPDKGVTASGNYNHAVNVPYVMSIVAGW